MPERLFRILLRLLPEDFRAGYARDMEATFRAEWSEAKGALRGGERLLLWLATLADVLRTAAAQHADVLRRDLRCSFDSSTCAPLPLVRVRRAPSRALPTRGDCVEANKRRNWIP